MGKKSRKNKKNKKQFNQTVGPDKSPKETNDQLKELEDLLTNEIDHNKSFQLTRNKTGDQNEDLISESTVLADIISKKRKQRRFMVLVGSLIGLTVLAIVAVMGFIYFGNNLPTTEENIELAISGPEKVTLGQEVTFNINYANKGGVDIRNAKLIFTEPNGFNLTGTVPEAQGRSWDLNVVGSGQQGSVALTGRIIDNLEVEQTLKATLIFVPLNFNSEFTTQTSYNISLEAPKIKIESLIPETITPGEKMTVDLKLTNETLEPIDIMKVKINYPDGFELTGTEPKTATEDHSWEVKNFEPATVQTIRLEGSFSTEMTFDSAQKREQKFIIELLYPNDADQYFLIQEYIFNTKIVDQALSVYMIINGSTENKNVSLEDTLNFSITYKNKGDKTYENLKIRAVINSNPDQILDWNNIDDQEFGQIEKTDQGRTVTWSKLQIPDLEEIEPKEEGTIDFAIPIKSFDDIEGADISKLGKNLIEAYASIQLTDELEADLPSIDGSSIILSLNSNVGLSNKALYYFEDGTPIGEGPLPPEVDKQTTYVIFWELTNDLHELENINVKTTLPEKVDWLEKSAIVSAGQIDYDAKNKELVWSLNRLPTSAEKASVTFRINLTPDEENIDKLMKLLNNTIVTATDTVTSDVITITESVLTTNLDEDEYGIGKGIVSSSN